MGMTRTKWWGLLVIGALALPATAQEAKQPGAKDGPLYIRSRNTRVLSAPQANASTLAVLQTGAVVTWRGPDAANPKFHKVDVDLKGRKVSGLVLVSNLSTQPPKPELVARESKRGFRTADSSAGAATKALSDGAVAYGTKKSKKNADKSIASLVALEKLAAGVDAREISAYASRAKISPVVQQPTAVAGGVTP